MRGARRSVGRDGLRDRDRSREAAPAASVAAWMTALADASARAWPVRATGLEVTGQFARRRSAVARWASERRLADAAEARGEVVASVARLLACDTEIDLARPRYRWRLPWTGAGLAAVSRAARADASPRCRQRRIPRCFSDAAGCARDDRPRPPRAGADQPRARGPAPARPRADPRAAGSPRRSSPRVARACTPRATRCSRATLRGPSRCACTTHTRCAPRSMPPRRRSLSISPRPTRPRASTSRRCWLRALVATVGAPLRAAARRELRAERRGHRVDRGRARARDGACRRAGSLARPVAARPRRPRDRAARDRLARRPRVARG